MTTAESIFLKPDKHRQFPLLIEDTKVYISKDILSLYSSVFDTLFNSANFCESSKNELPLPDKKLADFLCFLECLCSYPVRRSVDQKLLKILLALADEYDVKQIISDCEEFMARRISMLKLEPSSVEWAVLAETSHPVFEVQLASKNLGYSTSTYENTILCQYARLASKYMLRKVLIELVPCLAFANDRFLSTIKDDLPSAMLAAVYEAKYEKLSDELVHTVKQEKPGGCYKRTNVADFKVDLKSLLKRL